MALTRRQREIYDFVCLFVEQKRYSPSLEEIGAHFGLSSVATVHKHVQHLVEKGYLKKAWNRSRSVEPVNVDSSTGDGVVSLPLLGNVAAGVPIEAVEVPETFDVPVGLISSRGESFVLQVRGDSMIDDQICDGDFVVVESCSSANNGQTVVAMIRGEDVTLKRFYREGRQVRLQPANETMEPIHVPADEVEIRGVVSGLIRRY